jgi:hypothetical protein
MNRWFLTGKVESWFMQEMKLIASSTPFIGNAVVEIGWPTPWRELRGLVRRNFKRSCVISEEGKESNTQE